MRRKLVCIFAAALVFALPLAGCGASKNAASDTAASPSAPAAGTLRGEAGYPAPMPVEEPEEYEEPQMDDVDYDDDYANPLTAGGGGLLPEDGQTIAGQPQKIVYTVNLSLETVSFDEAVGQIDEMAGEVGGFVQDSYVEGTNLSQKYYARSADFTVRVPADRLDEYVKMLESAFHVVYKQKSSSNITGSYYDAQSRLNSLRVQEERLMAMLKESAELKYLLEVQRELADVQYQIDSLLSSLNRMDSSVSLSTVIIRLQEVNTYGDDQPVNAPTTFGERSQETLGDSWNRFVSVCQGILLALIALIPFLPLIAVVLIVVLLVLRRRRRKNSEPTGQGGVTAGADKEDPS